MAVKVSLKDWNVPQKLSSIATNSALGTFAAEEMGRGMSPYVPMESGVLSQSYGTSPFHVLYLAPYASYQYHGNWSWSKEMHPLATGEWDKAYVAAHSDDLTTAIQGFVDRM